MISWLEDRLERTRGARIGRAEEKTGDHHPPSHTTEHNPRNQPRNLKPLIQWPAVFSRHFTFLQFLLSHILMGSNSAITSGDSYNRASGAPCVFLRAAIFLSGFVGTAHVTTMNIIEQAKSYCPTCFPRKWTTT